MQNETAPSKNSNKGIKAAITGGMLASILASTCCVGPFVFTVLGISGAATLAKLTYLRIPMILAVLVSFFFAARTLFFRKPVCVEGSVCETSTSSKKVKILFWLGAFFAFIAIISPTILGWIGDYL